MQDLVSRNGFLIPVYGQINVLQVLKSPAGLASEHSLTLVPVTPLSVHTA